MLRRSGANRPAKAMRILQIYSCTKQIDVIDYFSRFEIANFLCKKENHILGIGRSYMLNTQVL